MECPMIGQEKHAGNCYSGGSSVAWGAKYEHDKAMVVVNGSGRLCVDDLKLIAKGATGLLQDNKASRVLLDCSEAILDVKVVDVYYLPECYTEVGVPRNAKIALILPKTRQPSGMFEFYETVCRNKGYACRLFDTLESAEQWLR